MRERVLHLLVNFLFPINAYKKIWSQTNFWRLRQTLNLVVLGGYSNKTSEDIKVSLSDPPKPI